MGGIIMWIARNKNGALWAYSSKPKRNNTYFMPSDESDYLALFDNDFKDVTWENSPKEIKCCPSLVEQLDYHFKTTPKEELDKEYKEISEKYPLSKQSDNIDWETIRINAAISAMQGMLVGKAYLNDSVIIASMSVDIADKLVNKLKKENNG